MHNEYTLPSLPLRQEIESKKVLKKIVSANIALAELKGVVKSMPNQSILINALSLQEAKDSSEVENIVTTHDELYRADISRSNMSHQAKEVQNYREALYRGFSLVQEHKLLLKKHIIEIQQVLENNNAGIRTQAGTTLKNEKTAEVIYTPPQNYQDIQNLMDNLEQYINDPDMDDYDTLVKMAIIHYQFESIHPFYDGNGRTGRIINILYLMLNGLLELPILYLSSYIINNKSDYYRLLTQVRTENSWEEWILYMLDGIEQTSKESVKLIANINVTMIEVKVSLKNKLPKIYSKDLLELIFKHPYTKIGFLVDELGVTRKTATSYLRAIADIGILESTKVGRDVYFINKQLFSLLQNR
ncbi:MAG: Fic/DOC family N-terminal domain-containing protein [Campylobacterota bacterium]|nr:Fic/DOC family N-terminal domain-containing protein [Campylobacterota bacterium]